MKNTKVGIKGFVSRPLAERFWEKVEKSGGCWFWVGSKNPTGYGEIWNDGRKRKATHVSLELAGTPLSVGQMACHRCDTPSCVRPDHLFGGTMSDNIRDCVAKGRHNSTTRPEMSRPGGGGAKLSAAVLPLILAMRDEGVSNTDIAKRFGVSRSTISLVCLGKTWRSAVAVLEGR